MITLPVVRTPANGNWPSIGQQVDPLTGKPLSSPPAPDPITFPHPWVIGRLPLDMAPPPPKRRTGLVVVLPLLIVVGVLVGMTVILTVHGHRPTVSRHPPVATLPLPSSSPGAPIPSYFSPQPISVPPLISGWQAVAADRDHVAYDVPPDWRVLTPGTIAGYENPDGRPEVVMHTVSDYRHGFCGHERGSTRAEVGFITPQGSKLEAQAQEAVRTWAAAAAEGEDGKQPSVTISGPRQVPVDGGEITATVFTGTAKPMDTNPCSAPLVKVTIAVLAKPDGTSALFTAVTDEQVPDALPDDVLARIISSVRPVGS